MNVRLGGCVCVCGYVCHSACIYLGCGAANNFAGSRLVGLLSFNADNCLPFKSQSLDTTGAD